MKEIRLDLKYYTKPDEDKLFPDPKFLTEHMVRAIVQLRYPQGINRSDVRIWAGLMDLMHEAQDTIQIEKSTLLWLIDVFNWCMDNSKIPALMASWVNTFYSHLEEVKKEGEADLKAVK